MSYIKQNISNKIYRIKNVICHTFYIIYSILHIVYHIFSLNIYMPNIGGIYNIGGVLYTWPCQQQNWMVSSVVDQSRLTATCKQVRLIPYKHQYQLVPEIPEASNTTDRVYKTANSNTKGLDVLLLCVLNSRFRVFSNKASLKSCLYKLLIFFLLLKNFLNCSRCSDVGCFTVGLAGLGYRLFHFIYFFCCRLWTL